MSKSFKHNFLYSRKIHNFFLPSSKSLIMVGERLGAGIIA